MAFCGCNRRREFFFIVYKVVPEITPKKTTHAENKKIVRKPFFHARCKINTIASIWREYMDIPGTLSDPRISEFSLSFAFGKLFASWNVQCLRINMRAYFCEK